MSRSGVNPADATRDPNAAEALWERAPSPAGVGGPLTIVVPFLGAGSRMHEKAQTVLIVDDEPDILEAIQELLHDAMPQVRVLTAHSGSEGLSMLRREHVDLIVTDYKMPGMTGVEFLEKARTLAPRTPRILVTAFGREFDRQAGRVEVDAFFHKPLEPGPLLRSVEAILGKRQT